MDAGAAAVADLLAVNTSGLLAGAGRCLKAAEIAAVRPDLPVALGEGAPLDAVLSDPGRSRRFASPAHP